MPAVIPLSPLFAALVIALVASAPAAGEDPIAPAAARMWTNKQGRMIGGSFVRLAGDELVLEQNGREVSFSITLLSDASAHMARKLAGMAKPPQDPPGAAGKSQRPEFQSVRPYRFEMGSPEDETGREVIETPHQVAIKRDFEMKTTEVTWTEWNAVRDRAAGYSYPDISPGCNGQGGDDGGQHPVLGITWWDALKWCNLKSQIDNRQPVYYTNPAFRPVYILKSGTPDPYVDWSANGYRLPTEAEWEFACRPGSSKRAFHTGPIRETGEKPLDANLDRAGWYAGNSNGETHPVAGKEPNQLGLYDMHGNAAEWCWDFAGPLVAGKKAVPDPRGAAHGETRIIRGGSWNDPAKLCRAAYRGSRGPTIIPNPFVGFRPVRAPLKPAAP